MFEVMIQKNPIAQLPAYFLYQVSGMRYSKSKIYRIGIVLSSVALISWFAIILSYVVPFVDRYGKYLSDKKLVEANADGVNWTWQRSLSWKDHTYYLNPLDPTINQKTKRILAQQADDLKEDAGLLILIFLTPVLIVLLGKILQWINSGNSVAQDINKSNRPPDNTTTTKYYHLILDGKQSQPYTIEQLKAMRIKEDDLVWHRGLTNWKPAKAISELKDIVLYTPPPIPSGPTEKRNVRDLRSLDEFVLKVKKPTLWFVISSGLVLTLSMFAFYFIEIAQDHNDIIVGCIFFFIASTSIIVLFQSYKIIRVVFDFRSEHIRLAKAIFFRVQGKNSKS
jgi:hypothetical protein